MSKAKQIIQRNLPLNQGYTLQSTYYQSIEDGGGCCCENCGRLITNIAVVVGQKDKKARSVGMDCAETLQGVGQSIGFTLIAQNAFAAAKSARAAMLKIIKKAQKDGVAVKVTVETFKAGQGYYKEDNAGIWRIESEPFSPHYSSWKQYPADYWPKHVLPMIKDLAT